MPLTQRPRVDSLGAAKWKTPSKWAMALMPIPLLVLHFFSSHWHPPHSVPPIHRQQEHELRHWYPTLVTAIIPVSLNPPSLCLPPSLVKIHLRAFWLHACRKGCRTHPCTLGPTALYAHHHPSPFPPYHRYNAADDHWLFSSSCSSPPHSPTFVDWLPWLRLTRSFKQSCLLYMVTNTKVVRSICSLPCFNRS